MDTKDAPTNSAIVRFYEEFGRNVRLARDRAKFTQADLARRTRLSRSSIANLEAGRQRIQLHVAWQIATALNVGPDKLLPEPSSQPPIAMEHLDKHLDPYLPEDQSFFLTTMQGLST